MKNFVQQGNFIAALAPYALISGQGALVGALFGIASADAANGAEVQLARTGVFDISALNTDTGAVGVKVYWDNTNKRITTTVGSNTLVGVLVAAKVNGDTTARVLLDGAIR